MNFENKFLKLNQAPAEGSPSGTSVVPKAPPAAPAAADGSTPKETGDNLDDFGYEVEKPEAPAAPATGEKKSAAPATPAIKEETITPSTGYGAEPPKPDAAAAPAIPPVGDPPAAPEKVELGFEVDVKELSPIGAVRIQKYALANKLTQEQTQSLLNEEKSLEKKYADNQAQAKAAYDKKIAETKAGWDKELREDKSFGGDKFAFNVTRVDKLLAEMMPEAKNDLTQSKNMLPPNVMRGLARIADHLYGTENLVHGDAPAPRKEEEKETDPLEYYNS